MKRRLILAPWLFSLGVLSGLIIPTVARAVDLEAFEFNDPATTTLANATNSVNAANKWIEDPQMAPSDMRGTGVYNIVKGSQVLESNYLQIGNITSGTRYLVMRAANWNFVNFDSNRLEEFRLAFLNDDTGNGGSTITAQMSVRRNAAGNVEIAGDALGTGSTNLPAPAPVAITRSAPFTAVLEINKTTNSYKVYYKDGTNPTQVLGLGTIASTRNGNSIRMAVNNDFSAFNSNYPVDPPFEVFAVDRIALTDTNPFTDLITLEVDRDSGKMSLKNTSGVGLTGLESYSITSASGSFDTTKWKTVTGNYDSGGNGTVDNAPWAVTTSSKTQLAEMFQNGDGGGLTNTQEVVLSVPTNHTWIQSPFEDVQMVLNFSGGVSRSVNVNFINNDGVKWASGDLNFDKLITVADWSIFIANSETNLSGLSRAEAYQRGDLTGDGFNGLADFSAFRTAYELANGSGSFELMLASVPEPASLILFAIGIFGIATSRRRRQSTWHADRLGSIIRNYGLFFKRDYIMSPVFVRIRSLVAMAALVFVAANAKAVIIEDFPFNDANSTPIEGAENVAHSGNNFFIGTISWDPSSVLNGNYRITKTTTGLATSFIDIANITTGKVWLVAELSGWNFSSTAAGEDFRFGFLDNDPPIVGSSTVTAQMDIRRAGAALQLAGTALGGGFQDVSQRYDLPLVRSTPFTMVLELDKGTDAYTVYYKDGTPTFTTLGSGLLGASTLHGGDRNGNGIRFGATGSYNDVGEFVDIDRIYLTDTSPVGPVVANSLRLEARSNGKLFFTNPTSNAISLDGYTITSATDALNLAGWSSLSDRNVSAVDGPDPGFTAGDGIGETWDEVGGVSDSLLGERFLLGSTTIAAGDSLTLESGFDIGGAHNLSFSYRDFVTKATVTGEVTYPVVAGVAGDYNGNGVVDGADYVVWRKNKGLTGSPTAAQGNGDGDNDVDDADYAYWRARFGNTSGSGAGELSLGASVPEPTALVLLSTALMALFAMNRHGSRN